jgi:hypothetical protein
MAHLTIGSLDKDGNEKIWKKCDIRHGGEVRAERNRGDFFKDAESLLPNGRLQLFVKATFHGRSDRIVVNAANSRIRPPLGGGLKQEQTKEALSRRRRSSNRSAAEDLCQMMLDNLVDLGGAASVLLVFEDGEQPCHTFPLASRQGQIQ